MTTRADVVRVLYTWLGTPWHHQASCKGVGADCARGLIVGVARELGLPGVAAFDACPEFNAYGHEPDPVMLMRACREHLDPCPAPGPGDILLFRYNATPRHFGIISKPGHMIHACAIFPRKIVENGLAEFWGSRLLAAFSYRGLTG